MIAASRYGGCAAYSTVGSGGHSAVGRERPVVKWGLSGG